MPNNKAKVPHVSPDFVWKVAPGSAIQISEKNAAGQGTAEFLPMGDAIVIKAKDQAPVVWALEIRRCAEAAIITLKEDGAHLHVLEMKSKLTQGEWAKAMVQLQGMFLSALAVARLLEIITFQSTTCYIAYTQNAMGPAASADLIMMKTFVGTSNPIGGMQEWTQESMSLPFGTAATIVKGQRDGLGNVAFGGI